MAEKPLQNRVNRQSTNSRIVTKIEEALFCVSNLVIEVHSGVYMDRRIFKVPPKPSNWPCAVMRLEQNIWVIKCARNIE